MMDMMYITHIDIFNTTKKKKIGPWKNPREEKACNRKYLRLIVMCRD